MLVGIRLIWGRSVIRGSFFLFSPLNSWPQKWSSVCLFCLVDRAARRLGYCSYEYHTNDRVAELSIRTLI